MTILIVVLIILLVLSIINNFYMYHYNYNESCPKNYIYSGNLPKNLKYKTITFFYKDNKFNKCHKNDYNKSDIPIRYEGDMTLNNMLSNLNNKKIKYIINNDNILPLEISELDYLKLRNL
tara:strand:- start:2103 stop:2462 length:360 start_codon:yes stop_codon:yes gene_type:complete